MSEEKTAESNSGDEYIQDAEYADADAEQSSAGKGSSRLAQFALLLALVGIGGSYFAWNAGQSVDPNEQQASENVQQQFAQVTDQITQVKEQSAQLLGQLDQARSQIAQQQNDAGQASDQLAPLSDRLSGLEQSLEQLRTEIQNQQAQPSPLEGRLSTLEQARSAESFAKQEQTELLASLKGSLLDLEQTVVQLGQWSEEKNAALGEELSVVGNKIDQELQGTQQLKAGMQDVFTAVKEHLGDNQDAWKLMEARFLLGLANQRLQFQRDAVTATAALNVVDQQLQALSDAAYQPVREQLAKEIAEMTAVQWPDVATMAQDIAGLIERVGELPVKGADYQPPDRSGAGDRVKQINANKDWRALPGVVWSALSDLVEVRRSDDPVGSLLSPQQAYFLYQNLRLQLEAARIAVLREDPANFRASLEAAHAWMYENFEVEAPAAEAVMAEIRRLMATEIRPALPDITESLRLLREIMTEQLAAAVTDASSDPTVAGEH